MGCLLFDRYRLDITDRRLLRDGAPVEVNARYLDALSLLVGEGGRLVSKDRLHAEVWRGVPVTDEALTQCIRTLRRVLGDDAARPRFIETVPKHGYRFIAAVTAGEHDVAVTPPNSVPVATPWRDALLLAGAGTLGAGVAGLIGGLVYGFAGASQPSATGPGAASVLIVLLCLAILLAAVGGLGVAAGIAVAERAADPRWRILGGAAGGMIVGAMAKLLGIDAFMLLFGRSPGDITGAVEGLLLGGAAGIGAWLSDRKPGISARYGVLAGGVAGAFAGATIALLGRRLLAGSLVLLAARFPDSRLHLEGIGRVFGDDGFGIAAATATTAFEGALFAGCLTGALVLARRGIRTSA